MMVTCSQLSITMFTEIPDDDVLKLLYGEYAWAFKNSRSPKNKSGSESLSKACSPRQMSV
jgi:hypothetical protein